MLLTLKMKLACALAVGFAGPLAISPWLAPSSAMQSAGLQEPFVDVRPGVLSYRLAGDFTRAGKQAAAPLRSVMFTQPLAIMKHQVSSAAYQVCVDDGGCRAMRPGALVDTARPVVQVSWHDAEDYAKWLSRKTGETYRLPTDEEWAFAAGSRFKDDGMPVDNSDPAKRWIARYEREADRATTDTATRPFGGFGHNEYGLLDLGGNVWEWTSTCFVRTELDDAGRAISKNPNCGVRIAEGQHRSYVTDFVRDARAGGCAAGLPPTNLGFRLVRDAAPLHAKAARFAATVRYALGDFLAERRSP
jgi:formylglycine-generating enzyme required for sulfatase activity